MELGAGLCSERKINKKKGGVYSDSFKGIKYKTLRESCSSGKSTYLRCKPWHVSLWEVPAVSNSMELLPSNFSFLFCSILLYGKVREPQLMLEVGSSWLRDQTNKSLSEYVSLLELYLLHVLLPLGRFEGAEELVYSCDVLDSEQKLAFVETICEKRCQWTQQEEMHSAHDEQEDKATETVLGRLSLCCLYSSLRFQGLKVHVY